MALAISNVDISTHSFQNWIDKTNILLESHSYNILTAAANTVGGITTGNSTVNGVFCSNTIAVDGNSSTIGLRGGNVTTNGVLYIISNTSIGNSSVNTVINHTTIDTDLNLIVLGNTTLVNTLITLTTNSTSNLFTFGAANANFDTGTFFVDAVNNRIGINNTAPGVALRVTGSTDISGAANVQGTANVLGTLGVANNVTIYGTDSHTIAGNVNFDNGTLVVDSIGDAVSILRPTTNTGWYEIKDGSVSGAGFKLYSLANNNIGSNITSAQTVVTISNGFKTGRLTVTAANSTQRQVEELLFCANSTDATITVFGRVALPTSANLGSVTMSNPNTTHLNINFTQNAPSTNVNISAVLFQ